MQLATATTAPAAITPGMVLATATRRDDGQQIPITAGRVLRTGVTDIRKTGWELISATHHFPGDGKPEPGPSTWGTVGFFKTGDAWTAVELLEPTEQGPQVLWTPFHLADVAFVPEVKLDAVWQVSHYGGDYSEMARDWIAPASHAPA